MAGPFARLRRGGDAGADSRDAVETGPDDTAADGTDPTTEMPATGEHGGDTPRADGATDRHGGDTPRADDATDRTQVLPAVVPGATPGLGGTASTEVVPAEGATAGEPSGAEPAVVEPAPLAAGAEPTAIRPDPQALPVAPAADAEAPPDQPADTEPAPAPTPSFVSRGRMRRRLRYVRRAREIALRDLGGLVFDLHRFGRDRSDLVDQKLHALSALDAEMRALGQALDEPDDLTVLREPGLASCPRCGALHASDAKFCSTCGLPVGKGASLPAGPTFAGPAPSPAAEPPGGASPAVADPPAAQEP
jgi:hypothetical protein